MSSMKGAMVPPFVYLAVAILLLILPAMALNSVHSGRKLDPHFYDHSCKQARLMVAASCMERAHYQDPHMVASMLRAVFHDCFIKFVCSDDTVSCAELGLSASNDTTIMVNIGYFLADQAPAPVAVAVAVPAPAAAACPKASAVVTVIDKYLCSAAGTALAVIMVYFPLLHYVIYANIEETTALWKPGGIEIGLANNMLWLFYGITVLSRDNTTDVLFGNSWGAAANLCFLLVIYAHKQQRKKASVVFITVLLCAIGALVLFQIEISSTAVKILETTFGSLGITSLVVSHIAQIIDLYNTTERKGLLSVLLTVAPNGPFAVIQCVTAFLNHRCQTFIMISSWTNIVLYLLEALLLFKMHNIIKKKSARTLEKMKTAFWDAYQSFRRPRLGDEEAGQEHELDPASKDSSSTVAVDFEEEIYYADAQLLDSEGTGGGVRVDEDDVDDGSDYESTFGEIVSEKTSDED